MRTYVTGADRLGIEPIMPEYRLYALGLNGLIRTAFDLVCDTDQDALTLAADYPTPDGFELWIGRRRVLTIAAAELPGFRSSGPSSSLHRPGPSLASPHDG